MALYVRRRILKEIRSLIGSQCKLRKKGEICSGGSHLQNQVKSHRQMMVLMSLVLVLIGPFRHVVIGCQSMKVVVIRLC